MDFTLVRRSPEVAPSYSSCHVALLKSNVSSLEATDDPQFFGGFGREKKNFAKTKRTSVRCYDIMETSNFCWGEGVMEKHLTEELFFFIWMSMRFSWRCFLSWHFNWHFIICDSWLGSLVHPDTPLVVRKSYNITH